jgi:leukotriene-A4 hydrolase
MKYLRPLYRALSRQPGAREAAVAAFEGNRAAYHPIAAKMVAADLGLDRGGGAEK